MRILPYCPNSRESRLCQGAYTIDAMVKTGEKDSNAKVLSYTEEINCPELLEGRLPQTPEECLAEPRFLQETGLFHRGYHHAGYRHRRL